MKIVNELEKHKIIAILRGFTSEQARRAVDAL